jgi:hypothetical protein
VAHQLIKKMCQLQHLENIAQIKEGEIVDNVKTIEKDENFEGASKQKKSKFKKMLSKAT